MKICTTFAILALTLIFSSTVYADPFGSGLNSFDIEFVTIGDAGNPADEGVGDNPADVGSVDQVYRIGKYEVSEEMVNKANSEGGLGITHDNRGANKPAGKVSWLEAAKFVNWLNTSSGTMPAYKFDGGGNFQLWQPGDAGYDPNNRFRNSQSKYFLPNADEWHKAAYYNSVTGDYGDYPTANGELPNRVISGTTINTAVYDLPIEVGPADIMLAGGLSPYGTMGQGGNLLEWEESELDLVNDSISSIRGMRGGYFIFPEILMRAERRIGFQPSFENFAVGFRVASVPEPSTLLLGALAFVGFFVLRKRWP